MRRVCHRSRMRRRGSRTWQRIARGLAGKVVEHVGSPLSPVQDSPFSGKLTPGFGIGPPARFWQCMQLQTWGCRARRSR